MLSGWCRGIIFVTKMTRSIFKAYWPRGMGIILGVNYSTMPNYVGRVRRKLLVLL